MSILAVIDVDDQGTLKVQNFRDALTDLGATVKKTDTEMGKGFGAPKAKDSLTQLITESRAAAVEAGRTAQGFGVLNNQLKTGSQVTALQASAMQQLAGQAQLAHGATSTLTQTAQTLSRTLQTGTTVTKEQSAQLTALTGGLSGASTQARETTGAMGGFSASALVVAAALGAISFSQYGLLKESGLLAGRVETLGIVMTSVARNAHLSSLEMEGQAAAVHKLGITTQESKDAVIQFAQANLRLSDTSKVARAAQDLAVVAGENSTQTFNRLTTAIQIQQPMLLRQVGIVSGLDQIYGEYAKTVGKTVKELDAADKKQAFVNKILEEGEKVAGAYEGAMTSAFKQIGSFARVVEDAKVKLGEGLQPAMLLAVKTATSFLEVWTNLPAPVQAFVTALLVATTAIGTFAAALAAAQFLGFLGVLSQMGGAISNFFIGLRAGIPLIETATIAFGGLNLAMGGIVIALGLAAAAYIYFTGTQRATAAEAAKRAADLEGEIINLETYQEKVNKAAKSVETYGAQVAALQAIHNRSKSQDADLAYATDQLTTAKEKLQGATNGLIKLAPETAGAFHAEGVALSQLNGILADSIDLRKEELAQLALLKQSELTAAEAKVKETEDKRTRLLQQIHDLEQQKPGAQLSTIGDEFGVSAIGSPAQTAAALTKLRQSLQDTGAEGATAAASVKKLSQEFDALRRGSDDKFKANEDLKQITVAIGEAREHYKSLGTTIETALALVHKSSKDLTGDPETVLAILKSASEAWDKHAADVAKSSAAALKSAQSYYEQITGDSVQLIEKLKVVDRALGEHAPGTDAYLSILLRAKDVIKGTATLTDDQTKAYKNLTAAEIELQRIDLAPVLKKYAEKATEVTDAFRELAMEGVNGLRESLSQFNEEANTKLTDQQRDFQEQILNQELDLYARTADAKMSEVDKKIFENNRYYQNLQSQANRQIRLLQQETTAEFEQIRQRTKAQLDALDEAKRRAELRFKIEVDTDEAIEKARKALELAGNKTPEEIGAQIHAIAAELHTALGEISDDATNQILAVNHQAVEAASVRAGVRETEIGQIREYQGHIVQANAETNAQIVKAADLAKQLLVSFSSNMLHSFTSNLAAIVLHTKSWKDAVVEVFQSLRQTLFSILDSIVSKWAEGLAKMILGVNGSGAASAASLVPIAAKGFAGGDMYTFGGAAAGKAAGRTGGGVAGTGLSSAALTTMAGIAASAGAGIVLERVGEKYFGGPGGKATTFGAVTGAGAGALIGAQFGAVGGPVGALIGGGVGLAYGAYRSSKNNAKNDRQKFLEDLGFSSLDELRQAMTEGGRAEDAQRLFETASNKIGKQGLQENKKWMEDVLKVLGQIETSKAWDQLVEAAGSVKDLKKQMDLLGLSYADLKMGVDAGDVNAVTAATDALNKALKERENRLAGLTKASQGLDALTEGYLQRYVTGPTDRAAASADKIEKANTAVEAARRAAEDIDKQLDKALQDAQDKRLKGLSTAAAGLQSMTVGFVERTNKNFSAIMDRFSPQERTTFEGIIAARKEAGDDRSNVDIFKDLSQHFQGDYSLKTLQQVKEAIADAQGEFNRMGAVATATFAGVLRETGDVVQAINAIGPSLSEMSVLQKELGLSADGAFGKLLRFQEVIEKNKDVADSLSGITQVLHGLSDSGGLTVGLFTDMGKSAQDMFRTLQDRGVEADQILMIMQPTLQALYEAQKKYGFATDETTQKLINMGVTNGVVGDNIQDVNHQMLDVLLAIGQTLGADIPDAYKKVKKSQDELALDKLIAQSKAAHEALDKATTEAEKLTAAAATNDVVAATKQAQDEFNRMGLVAAAVFSGVLADTGDVVQAMDAVGPSLDRMIEAQKAMGLEADVSFSKLLAFRQVINDNKDIAESFGGITQILQGLSQSGGLTQDLFTSMGDNASDLFDTLTKRGVDGNNAMLLMQPTLQALWEAQQQFGFQTDEATQKLIDMGLQQGSIGEHVKDVNHQILDVLLAIGKALGADLPQAYKDMSRAAEDSSGASTAAMDNAGAAVDDYNDKIVMAKLALRDLGQTAVDAGALAEDAATGAAEGHSPTGMKQLVLRLKEAQSGFRALRLVASQDMRDVERAATDAAGASLPGDEDTRDYTRENRQRYDDQEAARAAAAPPQVNLQLTNAPVISIELSSLDTTDMEATVRDRILPQILSASNVNAEQFATELEKALAKRREAA